MDMDFIDNRTVFLKVRIVFLKNSALENGKTVSDSKIYYNKEKKNPLLK